MEATFNKEIASWPEVQTEVSEGGTKFILHGLTGRVTRSKAALQQMSIAEG
jgi:hypothetical protein